MCSCKRLNVIDLFCGCGGLSLGFEKAGFNVLLGIDVWQDAITTFNHNHKNSKGLCADLSALNPKDIESDLNGNPVDIIVGVPQRRERVIIVGIRNDIHNKFKYPAPIVTEENYTPLSKVIDKLEIDEKKYYFSQKAVQGMKNAKNNMRRGLWQDLNYPCLTITSHLAKTSINSRDPVLLVNSEKEIYRRFTPREAARIQSFPDNFKFPVSEHFAYKQIGNAVPPVLMWHIMRSLQETIESNEQEII